LSIAAITDVTTPSNRSKSLALVGIAFSLAFTLGPSLGAYFASQDLFHLASSPIVNLPLIGEIKLNSYAVPAAITLGLLLIETVYLGVCLPETKGWEKVEEEEEEPKKGEVETKKRSLEERRERLRKLEWIHFGFLFFFSGELLVISERGCLSLIRFEEFTGAEFTITFLTNNLFDFTNAVSVSSLLHGPPTSDTDNWFRCHSAKWSTPRIHRYPLFASPRWLR